MAGISQTVSQLVADIRTNSQHQVERCLDREPDCCGSSRESTLLTSTWLQGAMPLPELGLFPFTKPEVEILRRLLALNLE